MNSNKTYDAYWQSGKHPDPHWDEKRIEKEFEHLKGADKILDYGSGPIGRKYGDIISQRCREYIGADVSPFIVQQNISDGFKSVLINNESGRVDLKAEYFDGAICCEVFEHLFDPLQAAKEIHRLLKPGGRVVAMVPNFGYHAWRIQALLRSQVPHEPEDPEINRFNGVHIRYFSTTTFSRLFTDSGFKVLKVAGYDVSSIWDISRGMGPLAKISDITRRHGPQWIHCNWLQKLAPSVFAMRLKITAVK